MSSIIVSSDVYAALQPSLSREETVDIGVSASVTDWSSDTQLRASSVSETSGTGATIGLVQLRQTRNYADVPRAFFTAVERE